MAAPAERHRSFRDPAGRLVPAGGRILRAGLPAGEPDLVALLDAPRARARLAAGDLVATRVLLFKSICRGKTPVDPRPGRPAWRRRFPASIRCASTS